jgi:peptidoglycan hydrolase-like protein with peptidoglycan-binding domain
MCAISLASADQTILSLQQTLKDQVFYYGTVTGEKNTETSAAIRRYQIRNGLRVTGELNEETSRSLNSSSNSVAAASRPKPKPGPEQSNTARPDMGSRVSENPPVSSLQPDRPVDNNPSFSASFYQPAPIRVNHRIIAGAQYHLMTRGYYRGRLDGREGRGTMLAVRAFQSSAGLPTTGRLDAETLQALGSSDADFAYSIPASRGYETWMPMRKFKHGKWKMKWKKSYRPFGGEDGDQDQQANTEPGSNPPNEE